MVSRVAKVLAVSGVDGGIESTGGLYTSSHLHLLLQSCPFNTILTVFVRYFISVISWLPNTFQFFSPFSEVNVEGNVATSDSAELFVTRRLESLHLSINLESGALLPLALR